MKECRCTLCGATGYNYAFRGASKDSTSLQCYRCGSTKIECYEEEIMSERDLRVIHFNNPMFHDGINCTVRRGYKWADLKIGEEILLNGDNRAIVRKLLICRFNEIKRRDISCEHDSKCRTIDGLFNTLSEIYPNFSNNSIVTIIYFELNENED